MPIDDEEVSRRHLAEAKDLAARGQWEQAGLAIGTAQVYATLDLAQAVWNAANRG